MVENAAWLYAKTCPKVSAHGGIQALCRNMGMAEQEFKRQLCNQIRMAKESYGDDDRITITIIGQSGFIEEFHINIPESVS